MNENETKAVTPGHTAIRTKFPLHTEHYTFEYFNHRDERETRRVRKAGAVLMYLSEPGYDYKPGFFLVGHCLDRGAIRSFALGNIVGEIQPNDSDYLMVSL